MRRKPVARPLVEEYPDHGSMRALPEEKGQKVLPRPGRAPVFSLLWTTPGERASLPARLPLPWTSSILPGKKGGSKNESVFGGYFQRRAAGLADLEPGGPSP